MGRIGRAGVGWELADDQPTSTFGPLRLRDFVWIPRSGPRNWRPPAVQRYLPPIVHHPRPAMIEDLSTPELIEKGRDAYSRDAYSTALMYLRAALERAPGYADVHNLVGLCLNLLGNTDEALAAFARAIEINPRYAEALVNQALTLQEIGRYEEAQAAFQRASEVDMEEGVDRFPAVLAARLANQHADLGDLYSAGGALSEAAEQYQRAVEIRPRFADIRSRLGRTLIELGDTGAAVRELEEALRLNPGFRQARINLGLAWYRSGDHVAARREWERCLEEDPGNPQVEAFLRLLRQPEKF